jgi:DUF1680 family protein
MHSRTGRWATYDTPTDGVRRASAHAIVFQAREGSPELNCCSVNSPRGFGMLSDWAVMQDQEGLVINAYGPVTLTLPPAKNADGLPGAGVTLAQETDYPVKGDIRIRVAPGTSSTFCLKLRIPFWSRDTRVTLNGDPLPDVRSGAYLPIVRRWQAGDTIHLALDMSLHYWAGERECAGLTSIYRGPLLLAFDHRYNLDLTACVAKHVRDDADWQRTPSSVLAVPNLDALLMEAREVSWDDWLAPQVLLEYTARNADIVRLCDFGSAGETGSPYRTWLPVDNSPATAFSRRNPLRSARV